MSAMQTPGSGIEEWRRNRLIASIWDCGDDWCGCTRPQVERITPNLESGYPWIRRETLWEGTFETGEGVTAQQLDELKEAATRYQIPMESEFGGTRFEFEGK
jgi:hypothetical protein